MTLNHKILGVSQCVDYTIIIRGGSTSFMLGGGGGGMNLAHMSVAANFGIKHTKFSSCKTFHSVD